VNKSLFLLILLGAGLLDASASNEVPLEVQYRNSARRANYARMDRAYQERLRQRQAAAVEQNEKVVALINTPPWMRAKAQGAVSAGENLPATAAGIAPEKMQKRNHRFLVSFMLLILIGTGAGWAWYKTREIDK
jgi:hypothetical protein